MTKVHITYNEGRGNMTINCENFFPAPQNKLKQLLNVVMMDYEHREDILKNIHSFLEAQAMIEDDAMLGYKKAYSRKYQEMCDMQRMVESCKHPNGLPLTKPELKTAKGDLKDLKAEVRELEQDFKKAKKNSAKLKVNAEIVKEKMTCGRF